VVRLALGAAFLRALRFSFLRSDLSVTLLVFATERILFPSICLRDVARLNGNGIMGGMKARAAQKKHGNHVGRSPKG